MVVEGEVLLRVDGEEGRLGPGDAAYIRRGARHGYRNVGDVPVRAVAFLGPLAPTPADGHVNLPVTESAPVDPESL
jgi:putative monooxygenase